METGVCYYPEHWSKKLLINDAKAIKKVGISWVRIGEFSWTLLEPKENCFDFKWLDQAIEALADCNLKIILGTPTACPPRWMTNVCPDLFAYDYNGIQRKFGSRRHYCFSSTSFQKYSNNIVRCLAKRYGKDNRIYAWQTDNEYGCHDTVLSYSPAARLAFQKWLKQKYQNIKALNKHWGNVFWSMSYQDFKDIELPNQTVTEPNPAHSMDFRRFSSDQVVQFNHRQVEIIKQYSIKPVVHNYMGMFTDFDHFAIGKDLDIASWDSYPLGFLSQLDNTFESKKNIQNRKEQFLRQGDPDFQAFHHDLYRRVGNNKLWIMEQQPGSVNWGKYNPIPIKGMVKLWSWEAFAHGSSLVSYFRWRQVPYAQEQMHTGLLNPANQSNQGYEEVKEINIELKKLATFFKAKLDVDISSNIISNNAKVAIVFDYPSEWAKKVQPMNENFSYFEYIMAIYRGLRRHGLEVDFIDSADPKFANYALIFIPLVFAWNKKLLQAIQDNSKKKKHVLVLGPGVGAKNEYFQIPFPLPPNLPEELLNIQVTNVDTYPIDTSVPCYKAGKKIGNFVLYREEISFKSPNLKKSKNFVKELWVDKYKNSALIKQGDIYYLTGCGDQSLLINLIKTVLKEIPTLKPYAKVNLPLGISTRAFVNSPNLRFIGNYGHKSFSVTAICKNFNQENSRLKNKSKIILGKSQLGVGDYAVVEIS